MAVYFKTTAPAALLKAFNDRIAQTEQKGKITTWERYSDNVHYTHKAQNWRALAYFKATVETNQLKFNIVRPKNKTIATEVYSYYHGHLIETFSNHFGSMFTDAVASSLPRDGDDAKP